MPEELIDDALATKEWRRLAPMLLEIRLLTDADRASLIACCLQWSRYLEATKKVRLTGMFVEASSGYPIPNPYIGIANRALLLCTKLWIELGLTPSSRSRVKEAPAREPDAFAEFDEPLRPGTD